MNYYRQFKDYLSFYFETINSPEYSKFLEKRNEDNSNYIEDLKKRFVDKNDYYYESDISLTNYYIYDFLSNNDVMKAIDKLNSLSNDEYEIECRYRKSTKITKYNYVQLEYSHYGSGIFANVRFKNDKFIDSIAISCTQVNNYYMMLEYEFNFKKAFKEESITEFLHSNLANIDKNDYFTFYNAKIDDDLTFFDLNSFRKDILPMVMQHFVTSLSYSPNGKNYRLNSLCVYTREEEIKFENMLLDEMSKYYYNKGENYLIESSIGDENAYRMLCGSNKSYRSPLIKMISEYGNEAYYLLFGYQDLRRFENKYNSLLQGTKKTNMDSTVMDLIKKVHSISDYRNNDYKALSQEIKSNWDVYIYGKKEEMSINVSNVSYYRKIYSQNLENIRLRAEINNTKSNNRISKVAVAIAIISIFVTIILSII